ncbi:hypothetical protein FOPG_02450 [Fusarium oxysporum f. sp. conglutinans race 2 54008]|uniref:Uncharacterized protein n=1 Tax=Fusarium oxysporum f. sp. conglutinans race 2 54008 TaxID=1089457 RepID=X0JKZ3_FUSOX|nr:hypothetical protein FOPG_02450 [Fusarium oxysporum f. sp. conglutinans race 2 54008]
MKIEVGVEISQRHGLSLGGREESLRGSKESRALKHSRLPGRSER